LNLLSNPKSEALLTALGLVFGVAATLVALLHDEKPSRARKILCLLALVGLGVGLFTTYGQYQDRQASDNDARIAKAERDKAKAELDNLVNKVGTGLQVQTLIDQKTGDLTMLNHLGGGDYYVVIDTFKRNSGANHKDCERVTARLLLLYPDARKSGLLWSGPALRQPSKYELRFGRNLTPSSAEIFQTLAKRGLSKGGAFIRRSGSSSPGNDASGTGSEGDVCPP
jgi:hypothetical protein